MAFVRHDFVLYLRTRAFGFGTAANKSSSKVFGSSWPTYFWPSRRKILRGSFWLVVLE